ncbi:MAG: DUF2845 domain-containing protein [Steroidobacteraceae bacterium]
MSARVALACAALLAAVPVAVRAGDTMRCAGQVITTGMSKDDVRSACGAPDSTEDVVQPVRAGKQVVGQTTQSVWTYASSTVTRVLVFDQDRLVSIQVK